MIGAIRLLAAEGAGRRYALFCFTRDARQKRRLPLPYLATAYANHGQFEEASRCIHGAFVAVETTKKRWAEAEVHRVAGEIALHSPEPDALKAESIFRACA